MSRNPPFAPVPGPLRIAIVTGDPLVRAGLASILEPGLGSGAIVDTLADADVALWDPGAEPARIHARLSELRSVPVPVLAVLPDPSFAADALAAGAGGVVLRDRLAQGLVAALQAVRHGFVVLDSALAEPMLPVQTHASEAHGSAVGDVDAGMDALTGRERQVVELLAQGLSNRRIAASLAISEHTAKFHVNSILSKLGATTRTEAVVEAVRRGLVIL